MTKKAFQSFAFGTVVVNEDEYFADDHPYVLAYPDRFGDLNEMITVRQAPPKVAKVEKATANPGEGRNAAPPK